MPEVILTDTSFKAEVLDEKSRPVLVDFWATWCGPCKVQGPIVEDIAKEIGGKAKIAKMEVDENPNTPMQYAIMSIPTIVIFKDGKPVWRAVGLQTKQAIMEELKKVV